MLTLLFFISVSHLTAQASTIYTEAWRIYKLAEEHQAERLYALAQREYAQVRDLLRPINEADAELLRQNAELNYAKLAVRLGKPDGEKLVLDFVRRNQPNPIANEALLEMANYYFNENDLAKAVEYYERIPQSSMSRLERAEVSFRLGYANFVQQRFREAKRYFSATKDIDGDFYYPTNYYLGMIYFFEGNYDGSIRQLRIAERSPLYKNDIPYYLSQIYFAQRRYNELISYAQPLVENSRRLRNDDEIKQLLGQAYFEQGQYAQARPYLEAYAKRNRKMREEELYQLGFVRYQMSDFPAAAEAFQDAGGADSPVGQSANFMLGDTYLRLGDRPNARTAFGNASRMNYDAAMREEALFNYAKLSYELRDPRSAINALQQLPPASRFYVESQRLLGDIFATARDYQGALDILDKMPNRTPELQEAYQKAAFNRGLQLLQDGDRAQAKLRINQSLRQPVNAQYRAMALYWLADLAHQEEDYATSINLNNQFLTLARTVQGLPPQSSLYSGNYLQGYNYLKQDNYPAALDYFKATVEGIQRNAPYITDATVRERILGDAVMRSGDAYFQRNQYDQAIRYYDEAVNNQYQGYVYALYQKAIIEGLRNRNAQKVIALERIANDYPRSEYADNALFELGMTYQQMGQLQQALQPFRTIISDYKNTSPLVNGALLQLGLVSYNLANQEAAVNYYKQVFGNNPTESEANAALSALEEIYVRDMGRADLYFSFLETIPGYQVDSDGRDNITFQAAEAQYENGNYQRAVNSYTDYIRQYPQGRNTLAAYMHRGDSYTQLRQYENALADYEAVAARGNSQYYVKALKNASLIAYNVAEDFSRAYNLYTQLESSAPDEDTRFEAQLGALRSAYRLNNTSAVEQYAAKVANAPNATPQQRTTANFYLGKIAYDRQQWPRAINLFDQVIASSDDEQTAEARYLRANVYYLQRNLDRAQELVMEANRESSGYPYWVAKSVILLADILRDKRDLYNARAALEALLENYNEDAEVVQEAQQKLARVQAEIDQSSQLNRQPTNPNGYLELDNGGG